MMGAPNPVLPWLAVLLLGGVVSGQSQNPSKAELHFVSCGLGSSNPQDAIRVFPWSPVSGLRNAQESPIEPQTIETLSPEFYKEGEFLAVGGGSPEDAAPGNGVFIVQTGLGQSSQVHVAKLDSKGFVAINSVAVIARPDGSRGISWRGTADRKDRDFFSKSEEVADTVRSASKIHDTLFYAGVPGGPSAVPYLYVSRVGNKLHVGRGNEGPVVDELTGAVDKEVPKEGGMVVGADSHHFILAPLADSGTYDTKLLIHNLKTGEWRTARMPGVGTRVRWFSPWLAGIVEHVREPNRIANPGRELEPIAIQTQFANQEGANRRIDGQLWLYNVETQQVVTIETGQEDSEVLGIKDGQVFYRTTDAVFRGSLANGGMEAPRLLIRDYRLARVHWLF